MHAGSAVAAQFSGFENRAGQTWRMSHVVPLIDPAGWLEAGFAGRFGAPTPIQRAAWPVLRQRRDALLIAPTGQGKTLAAWRPLVERMLGTAPAGRGVRALHVAPLKALARDMTVNLGPLLELAGDACGRAPRIGLRCGDTPRAERAAQRQRPPEILSTTPESLFVLLGSPGGRGLLASIEAVVVDEWHALAGSRRGAHLGVSLARLEALAGRRVQRIGLSATARPAAALARALGGSDGCEIIDVGPGQPVALCIEVPGQPLGAFPDARHWQQIHARIAALSAAGALLVFCQTRAQVERSAAALDALLAAAGRPGQVGAHHGSLDAGHRELIESRFRLGRLGVMVSSASLELGLDLGGVERVCQIGTPGSVNRTRQRAGRSGHRPGERPRMHLFPLTLNQLIEARALDAELAAGRIEAVDIGDGPDDVLAQQAVALVVGGVCSTGDLLAMLRSAWPYRHLDRARLERVLAVLAERVDGMPEVQTGPLLVRDRDDRWRAGAGAGRIVMANAGTIPEFFEYAVVRDDTGAQVGTLDEEFAFEASPGQVVQLGHRTWRILRVRTGCLRVEPAAADAADMPFWFGEGPGRTPELSQALLATLDGPGGGDRQVDAMLAAARRALGALPAPDRLIVERFADPNGDRHVVLHTFAGARINRAWGLALRKRFCRRFNFELQAAATDDGILISLGVNGRFELSDMVRFVSAAQAREVLTQALLDTPLFLTRFRWAANTALLLPRTDARGPVTPQRQRSRTENLIACVFPDQLACLENLHGPREVPDHPLVGQALSDCLNGYMDLSGLEALLGRLESGALAVHGVDVAQPSPLAEALIHAPRHSYLDEAAAEERRTRNFESASRDWRGRARQGAIRGPVAMPPEPARGPAADPLRRPSVDALERLLADAGFLTASEGGAGRGLAGPVPAGGWTRFFAQLVRQRRAVTVMPGRGGERLWVAIEWLAALRAVDPGLRIRPWIAAALIGPAPGDRGACRQRLIEARGRIDGAAAGANVAASVGPGADRS